jgi:hypothetical protein
MIIDFRQGIVKFSHALGIQTFLQPSGGYVSLLTPNGVTIVSIAAGDTDYLISELVDVPNAWGPLAPGVQHWIYWDINPSTAVRTFGCTIIPPLSGFIPPNSPADDQHWFNKNTNQMQIFKFGRWRNVIRVFAAKVTNNTIAMLGSMNNTPNFVGTQVGIVTEGTKVGAILVDDRGNPIHRSDGSFLTTEQNIFSPGAPSNSIRSSSNALIVTATEPIPAYSIVRFIDFDVVSLATSHSGYDGIVAIATEDIQTNSTGSVCTGGWITNPIWTFPEVGQLLYSSSTGGQLTHTHPSPGDPRVLVIAKVLWPDTIIFGTTQ